jgi:hypothetical protein
VTLDRDTKLTLVPAETIVSTGIVRRPQAAWGVESPGIDAAVALLKTSPDFCSGATTMKFWTKRALPFLVCGALVANAALLSAAEEKKVDLKIGDPAPEFTSVDDQGKPWKSADHVGKKILVLWFYPADLTGG